MSGWWIRGELATYTTLGELLKGLGSGKANEGSDGDERLHFWLLGEIGATDGGCRVAEVSYTRKEIGQMDRGSSMTGRNVSRASGESIYPGEEQSCNPDLS
jgi:hypothetical protein